MYMANADQSKYGSILTSLEQEYVLLEDKSLNRYPKGIVRAHHSLEKHKWDATYKKQLQKDKGEKNQKPKADKEKTDEKTPSLNLSFAQYHNKGICYCCGQKHAFQDCPKKDTTPRSEWFIKYQDQSCSTVQPSCK